MTWYRNKRHRGWSKWHWDPTPEAPDCMKSMPVNLKQLPISLCETAYHNLLLDETSDTQPPAEDCCEICLKKLGLKPKAEESLTLPLGPMPKTLEQLLAE
jgi:hypothetical protein